jgi:hypothetical protein
MKNQTKYLFAELAKTEEQDDGTIKVMGYASSESKDAQGEVIKADAIAAAIPDFMKYGTGNLREMHKSDAAGTVPFLKVLDDGRTEIHAHVVDPVAVQKVKTGVYKGFSIGGSVTQRDSLDKSVIKGVKLSEISLVDRPANPEAVITFFKLEDGAPPDAATDTVTKSADELAVDELADMLNKGDVSAAQLVALAKASGEKPTDDDEQALRKQAQDLGLTTLHSLHLALSEGVEATEKADLTDAMFAIGDEATKGDFPGHPFRGNQHTGGSSSGAVGASQKAKHAEKHGSKSAQRSAHSAAHKSHKEAAKGASGKTKEYHDKMASFHASRAKDGAAKSVAVDDLQKFDGGKWRDELKKYAGCELDDAAQAMAALSMLRWVFSSEMDEIENEPEQVHHLLDAIDSIKAFIQSELDENTLAPESDTPMETLKADKPTTLAKRLHDAHAAGHDARMAKAMESMAKTMADMRKADAAKDARIDELAKAIGNMPTAPKGGQLFVMGQNGQVEDQLIVKHADGTTDQNATAALQIRKAREAAGMPV